MGRVFFEGADGSGKTPFAHVYSRMCGYGRVERFDASSSISDMFFSTLGCDPGVYDRSMIGSLVYMCLHGQISGAQFDELVGTVAAISQGRSDAFVFFLANVEQMQKRVKYLKPKKSHHDKRLLGDDDYAERTCVLLERAHSILQQAGVRTHTIRWDVEEKIESILNRNIPLLSMLHTP